MKRKNEFDEWLSGLTAFQLPRWQELSAVTLYMDQLINTVEKHLTVFGLGQGEKLSITPAMVNNYVKLGLMPKPIKKRYNRRHIAYLIIITLYKQVISINEIKDALRYLASVQGSSAAYDQFCDTLERSMRQAVEKYVAGSPQPTPAKPMIAEPDLNSFLIWTACETIVNMFFAKKIISLIEPGDQANAAPFSGPTTDRRQGK